MSLRVNLKLKLSKTVKKITVKYNTFEKATYDQYLITSLILRSASKQEAFAYIDDITGVGSLNAHFKRLYEEISILKTEQQEKILQNSMYPILKIDDSNRYDFYPQLNVSVFHDRVYDGDIAKRENLQDLLYIKEDILDLQVNDMKISEKPEPYNVEFGNNGSICVTMRDKKVNIDSALFESVLDVELDSISKYEGTIHNGVDGAGWSILNNSTVNNLFSNNNYFYDAQGDHLQIRNENIRKTEIAKMSGLYIYRESLISYDKNDKLCEKVLDVVCQNYAFSVFKPQFFVKLLQNLDEHNAVEFLNLYFDNKCDTKEMELFVVQLLKKGYLIGWSAVVLKAVLKHCTKEEYSLLYRANLNIGFSINQLIAVDKGLLNAEHKKQVEDYYTNLNSMKATIKDITGDITVSGLRENVKKLTSDEKTKRFSKLCNNLIGHVSKGLETAGWAETEQWLKDALELKELAVDMRRRLALKNPE